MNFSIDFEAENGLCVYRISGKLAPDELLSVFAMARIQPGWSDDYDFLTILDHVSLSDIRADSVTRMMDTMRENDDAEPAHKRRAAIVCNDPFSKATLTYWELASRNRLTTEERVFQHETQARAWLSAARTLSNTAN